MRYENEYCGRCRKIREKEEEIKKAVFKEKAEELVKELEETSKMLEKTIKKYSSE